MSGFFASRNFRNARRTAAGLKRLFAMAIPIVLSSPGMSAHAAESITYGGPRGGTDIGEAYLPPVSGFYGVALVWAATPNAYYGNNNRTSPLKFDGTAIIPGLGLLYVYPFKLAGGTLATSALETDAGYTHLCVNNVCKTVTGLGDLYSDILMWSRYLGPSTDPHSLPYGLTVKAAFSMQFPTGKYQAYAEVPSFGYNVYRIIPNVALTYLTGPNALGDGVELSTQVFYGITPVNSATNYKSGDTVDIDFAVSERTGRWQYGIAGNYAFQLQGDKVNGVAVPGGNKIGIAAIGPVVSYAIPSWKSVVKAKLQLPIYTKNTAHQVSALVSIVKAF